MKKTNAFVACMIMAIATQTYSVGVGELVVGGTGFVVGIKKCSFITEALAALAVTNACATIRVIAGASERAKTYISSPESIDNGGPLLLVGLRMLTARVAKPLAGTAFAGVAGIVSYPLIAAWYGMVFGTGYVGGWMLR